MPSVKRGGGNAMPARRRLLKNLAATSVLAGSAASLPSNWTRPVVQAVVLPAHAVASGHPPGGPPPSTLSAEDPCFLNLNCINDGDQVQATASGQVIGPSELIGGVQIDVVFRLLSGGGVVSTSSPSSTTTATDGSWGPGRWGHRAGGGLVTGPGF